MDVLPKLLIEMREDAAVEAIVGQRVRGAEPAKGDADWDDLTDGTRKYKHAFVVLVRLSAARDRRLPIQRPRFAVRCYGRDRVEAAALRWACSDAIHMTGPRVHGNGLGIYTSFEDAGGEQDRDPVTGQPLETFIVQALATTQAVAN
jgi:hypothetical protein